MKNKILKNNKTPNKKRKFKIMGHPPKKQPAKKSGNKKSSHRLKIDVPFEEAMKIAFNPKSNPVKK